jgi:hypothetical protein
MVRDTLGVRPSAQPHPSEQAPVARMMENNAPAGVLAVKVTLIGVFTSIVPLDGLAESVVMDGAVAAVAVGGAQCSDADVVRVVPAVW